MTREERNAQDRERYAFFKARHLCTKCGRGAELNKTLCSRCLEKHAAYNSKYFAQPENMEKSVQRKRELRAKRRELGICMCGKERYSEHTTCYECMLKNRRVARERYVPKQRNHVSVPPRHKPSEDHPWRKMNNVRKEV